MVEQSSSEQLDFKRELEQFDMSTNTLVDYFAVVGFDQTQLNQISQNIAHSHHNGKN